MWRRTYLFLVVLRLYLALSPSYIHPDEHFQGPEVIAGLSSCECASLVFLLTSHFRPRLWISISSYLGIYIRNSHPQCLPSLASIWPAFDSAEMDLRGHRLPGHLACRRVLYSARIDVCPKFCS